MIVIVEGIDRVGKTTLCEKLKERGFIILKDDIEFLNQVKTRNSKALNSASKIDTTFNFLVKLHEQGLNVVVDRLHLTELVYGTLDREACCPKIIWELEQSFVKRVGGGAVLVLVEPTNIVEANERAGRDLSDHADFFETVYQLSLMWKLKCDFTTVNDMAILLDSISNEGKYDFYLASPFFRPDQVEREERIKAKLRDMGYKVFSPKEYSFLQTDADLDAQSATFFANCEAIQNSTAVFAITDTKDMGTIWEAGYAFGIKKPVIYFAETLGDNPFNLMLAQSGNRVFTSESQLNKESIDAILNNPSLYIPYGGGIE